MCQVVRRRKEGERKLPLTWDKTKKMRGGKQQFGGIKTKKKEKRKRKRKKENQKGEKKKRKMKEKSKGESGEEK